MTRHYQWMLRTDYLPRICAAGVVNDVFSNGRKAFEVGVTPTDVPTMPIEFSVASFRLGHSMIRRAYNWNKIFDFGSGTLDYLFIFGGEREPRRRALPRRHVGRGLPAPVRLLRGRPRGPGGAGREVQPRDADRHETRSSPGPPGVPRRRETTSRWNFKRAKMVRLATGQQMATFLKSKGVTLTKLTAEQIREGRIGATLEDLTQAMRTNLVKDTPLWFYILREAELNQGRLKGVGARIVAETFHRAMEGSQISIVRHPTWRPSGAEQHDVPHGRSAALRVPGAEEQARAARLARPKHRYPIDVPAIRDPFQLVLAGVLEPEAGAGDEVLHRLRDQHLRRRGHRSQPAPMFTAMPPAFPSIISTSPV